MKNKYNETVQPHDKVCGQCSQRIGYSKPYSTDTDGMVICSHCSPVENPCITGDCEHDSCTRERRVLDSPAHDVEIEVIFDSEDELWFAGVRTGLPTGPWSQRGEFFAFPGFDANAGTMYASAYTCKEDAESAVNRLMPMTENELRAHAPGFWKEGN